MSITTTEKKETKKKKAFSSPASEKSISNTITALNKNGIQAFAFDSEKELKSTIFKLIPEKAEVMTMTSVTLDKLGITEEISNSDRFDSVRNKLKLLDAKAQRKIGSNADYTIGSVHAVTENGELLIASATGSQLSAYAYASGKIILVVGTQKIVKNKEEGIDRIYKYSLPLENERAKKVYNMESKVAKILTVNSETPNRITVLFLKQNIGF